MAENGDSTVAPQTLEERLKHIRSSPNLQSQKHSAAILSAVEDTLREQKSSFTPTAYFAALLSLLTQYVSSSSGIVQKELAVAVVYLLDLVTPHVPAGLLTSKFSAILNSLAPALSHPDADAPFLRAAIGCLVSLLLVQDAQAWALPQSQVGPRKAVAGLLTLAMDRRPKVRKRAQAGLASILQNGPPTPSLDHPAADMCAETALRGFEDFVQLSSKDNQGHESGAIHTMQLIKTVASACGGWPSKSLEPLCEVLFTVAKSRSEFLTMAAFDVFESIFRGIANDQSASKLPRLLEIVGELQPSQNDTQLLPPWLAIISRGYDVSAQLEPHATFERLPPLFNMVSEFLASSSYNIRVSASECLISLLVNCVPIEAVHQPSEQSQEIIHQICITITGLLSVKYQSSWMEVFSVLAAAFESLRSQSFPALQQVILTVGELRGQDSFSGKTQADQVLMKAISAVGSESFLSVLPLNLVAPKAGQQGRAWIVPLLRDSVRNDSLAFFKRELLPLSEHLFQRVLDQSNASKSMETKIFETLVQQIWDAFPGYCDLPLDLRAAFDQPFAEIVCNLLYQKPEMRTTLCRALQNLVESNQVVARLEDGENPLVYGLSREEAQENLNYLAGFASNMLAVLFNVYTETAPQQRASILECLDAYLSITSPGELSDTFTRVASMLESSVNESVLNDSSSKQGSKDRGKPGLAHALMDIVVAIATYLPRDSYQSLFGIASAMIGQKQDSQLQKKAYRLIPRLAQSEIGAVALRDRNPELQKLLLDSAETVLVPARKDRMNALSEIIQTLPAHDLHFIASVLPEIILCTKETKERTRHTAFDLLILVGEKMQAGGTIDSSKITQAPTVAGTTAASLEEYLTMLSAGLAGNTSHMISASVTAITRVFYQFHKSLSEVAVKDLVQTMDLFLKSPSREVVRAVLGFVKVCVLSLPVPFMLPRLHALIPALMPWSQEHKGHFKEKVKNLLERMIRRYGFDAVDRNCPDENKKLITHIRKQRDRRKRGKAGLAVDSDNEDAADTATKAADAAARRNPRYANEFDQAIYGSDSDSPAEASSGDDDDDDAVQLRGSSKATKGKAARRRSGGDTYIHEDEDEPLDLLGRRALANISSTRPLRNKDRGPPKRVGRNAKVDEDGRLVLRDDDEADSDEDMEDVGGGTADLQKGINAYVDAIRGRDAAKRGQRGRLKFSNKGHKGRDDEDDVEDDEATAPANRGGRGGRGGGRGFGRGRGQVAGRGQIARGGGVKPQRGRGGGGGMGRGRGRAGRVVKHKFGARKRL